MERAFLCVIERRGNGWNAICLDLDIAVAGTSFDTAKQDLEAAIRQYVHAARDESPADRDRLLGRRAPLSLRVRALLHVMAAFLKRGSSKRSEAGGTILLPCPA